VTHSRKRSVKLHRPTNTPSKHTTPMYHSRNVLSSMTGKLNLFTPAPTRLIDDIVSKAKSVGIWTKIGKTLSNEPSNSATVVLSPSILLAVWVSVVGLRCGRSLMNGREETKAKRRRNGSTVETTSPNCRSTSSWSLTHPTADQISPQWIRQGSGSRDYDDSGWLCVWWRRRDFRGNRNWETID